MTPSLGVIPGVVDVMFEAVRLIEVIYGYLIWALTRGEPLLLDRAASLFTEAS